MDSCNNTCCSFNNDRCILECTDPNNCCVLNICSGLNTKSALNSADILLVDVSNVSSTLDHFDVNSVLDSSDPLLCDIEIPQFPVKINVNELDEIPTLDELLEASDTNHNSNKDLSHDELQNVMLEIEDTVNFNSMEEGLDTLDDPDIIFSRIQTAFNTFKEKTGRQMTYSEMRQMMG